MTTLSGIFTFLCVNLHSAASSHESSHDLETIPLASHTDSTWGKLQL
jgi:hypothetical protein